MSLADQLKDPQPVPCKVARLGSTLPQEDRETFWEAMEDRTRYSGRRIAKALAKEGYELSHTTVQAHRDELCTCYRKAHIPGTR